MSQTLSSQLVDTKASVQNLEVKRGGPTRKLLACIPLWVLVGLLLVVELYPLLWMLLSSFKTTEEFSTGAFWALPTALAWQNYVQAWTAGMSTYFLNSILTVFPSLFLILVISLAASFALEVMKWRGSNIVLLAFLGGVMVSLQMTLLPLFTHYRV